MKALTFFNGYGGFEPDTADYVITNTETPVPWCNIITNPVFGTLVTQSGASHTWYGNSSLFRLSPKVDDSVKENSGERLFLKNEMTDSIWEPMRTATKVKHSFGSTIYDSENDIDSEVTVFVYKDSPVKVVKIKLKNNQPKASTFSATYYLQPVLGEFVEKTKADIVTSFDAKRSHIVISNPGSFYYPGASVYVGTSEKEVTFTLNRTEFLGRDSAVFPVALKAKNLSCKNTPANDPIAVLKTEFKIKKDEEKTVYFFIGVQDERESKIIDKMDSATAENELLRVKKYWEHLPAFQIDTPNQALNTMVNNWLMYQIVSSRIWGKTGFWQPGGAFGFRDQLQDILALIWSDPEKVREHILLSASRQFVGGDVQHWWHPPRGDGVRTTSSDAALWLVYAVNYYIAVTGDMTILDEEATFLQSVNKDHKPGSYFVPEKSEKSESIYNHCVSAIERSLYLIGIHGLPLILSGDWNDSLSKIGAGKRGESVWMAQFLGMLLHDFIPLCDNRNDEKRVAVYQDSLLKLQSSLEKSWDGDWYRRAYWDDSSVLGSATNKYCRIDGLTQNWSVISGVGSKERSKKAMVSLEKNLINWKSGEVRLLSPAFNEEFPRDPGYIITYPPGTRENGGTYSHNASWTSLAFSILGEGNKATGVLDILNPILRTNTQKKADMYRGEPYVMASDIYSEGVYSGQAGWTWYTGSASVFYRTAIENILGIVIRDGVISFSPCINSSWKRFSVSYRHVQTLYLIEFENPKSRESGVKSIYLDTKKVDNIVLANDKKEHFVKVVMG